MRLHITAFLLPAALVAVYMSNAKSDGAAKPSFGPDYETLAFEAAAGQTVYGLRCKNGGTDCGYKWESLCAQGKAENADAAGQVQASPSYSHDAQGHPVRMYVCK